MKRGFPLLLLAAALLAGCSEEETYPSRPIVLYCPWSAGGGTDRVSRQMAFLLEQELGVKVNVVNATGGQGVTGHSRGAVSRPDGYALTMMTVELNMLHWRGLTSITHESFAPLALLNRDAAALFIRADAPWKTLKELEARVKDSPDKLKASGTGQGGIWHLALAGWYPTIGKDPADLNWLSNKGSAPSIKSLLAGDIEVVCCSLPEARSQMQGRQVRCLGVMADERVPGFEDVPTFKEQGFEWSMGGWRALGVPADTPKEVVDVLVGTTDRIVNGDAFREFMRKQGFNWTYEGPEKARDSLMAADESLGGLLTSQAFRSIRRARYGPMVFPATLGVAIGVVLAGLLATGGFKRGKDERPASKGGLLRFGECILAVALYLALADWVGFVLTAGPLLGLLLWRWGSKPWVAALIAALAVSNAWLVFASRWGLGVQLPAGLFP